MKVFAVLSLAIALVSASQSGAAVEAPAAPAQGQLRTKSRVVLTDNKDAANQVVKLSPEASKVVGNPNGAIFGDKDLLAVFDLISQMTSPILMSSFDFPVSLASVTDLDMEAFELIFGTIDPAVVAAVLSACGDSLKSPAKPTSGDLKPAVEVTSSSVETESAEAQQ